MSASRIFATAGAIAALAFALPLLASSDMGMGGDATFQRAEVEAKVKQMFGRIDGDKDGAVTRAEAQAARKDMRGDMRTHRFDMLDTDKNGSISREEFDAGHRKTDTAPAHHGKHTMHGGMKHEMGGMHMFDRADANKDGKVILSEAVNAALSHFDRVDTNHDAKITPEERRAFHAQMGGEMTDTAK